MKLKYDELLSSVASAFILRRHTEAAERLLFICDACHAAGKTVTSVLARERPDNDNANAFPKNMIKSDANESSYNYDQSDEFCFHTYESWHLTDGELEDLELAPQSLPPVLMDAEIFCRLLVQRRGFTPLISGRKIFHDPAVDNEDPGDAGAAHVTGLASFYSEDEGDDDDVVLADSLPKAGGLLRTITRPTSNQPLVFRACV